KNITFLEIVRSICLYDFCFSRNEPDQHMLVERNIRFEEFIIVAGKLDVVRYIFCFIFHCLSFNFLFLKKEISIAKIEKIILFSLYGLPAIHYAWFCGSFLHCFFSSTATGIAIVFISRYSSNPTIPFSRPIPDCL